MAPSPSNVSNPIVASGYNNQGNYFTRYKDGQYTILNYDADGNELSFYRNGGSSGINHLHRSDKPELSWYENKNTGEGNRHSVTLRSSQQN